MFLSLALITSTSVGFYYFVIEFLQHQAEENVSICISFLFSHMFTFFFILKPKN